MTRATIIGVIIFTALVAILMLIEVVTIATMNVPT